MPSLLGLIARFLVGAHVEADDDRLRRRRQRDVGFGDAADAAMDDARRDFVGAELFERGDDRLDRALHVALDDERQFLAAGAVFSWLIMSCSEVRATPDAAGRKLLALLALAIFGDFAGARLVLDDGDAVAGFRRAGEAEHLDRASKAALRVTFSPLSSSSARTRPHCEPATTISPTFSVPRWTSTVATGPRPRSSRASMTVPSAVRSGSALRSSSSACSAIASSSLSRLVCLVAETSTSSVSPPIASTCTSYCSSSCCTRCGIGVGLVDLVDRHDDRHVGRLGVADRLDRLRHDAVVGGHDQHDDVGHLGAAGAHRREGRVAGRVDEGDLLRRPARSPDRRRYAA